MSSTTGHIDNPRPALPPANRPPAADRQATHLHPLISQRLCYSPARPPPNVPPCGQPGKCPPRLSGKSCPSVAAHWFPKRLRFILRYFMSARLSYSLSTCISPSVPLPNAGSSPRPELQVLSTSKSYVCDDTVRQKAHQRQPAAPKDHTARPSSAEGFPSWEAHHDSPGKRLHRGWVISPPLHGPDSEQWLRAMSFCQHRTKAGSLLPLRARGLVSPVGVAVRRPPARLGPGLAAGTHAEAGAGAKTQRWGRECEPRRGRQSWGCGVRG